MRNETRSVPLLVVVLLGIALGGCSVYRAEVRQGNFIDDSKMTQVIAGMTREQVEFLLGPPMVADPFHRDRWDYVYTLESVLTNGVVLRRHFVVYFDGDRVRETKNLD